METISEPDLPRWVVRATQLFLLVGVALLALLALLGFAGGECSHTRGSPNAANCVQRLEEKN